MKYILGTILSLFCTQLYAAPTDCIQLASDGEVNCIKAKSQFKYGVSNAPLTDTFEETVAAYEGMGGYCKHVPQMICYIQYQNTPTDPPAGKTITGTDYGYTNMNYQTSNNAAGQIVTTYYVTTHKTYAKYNMIVFHFRTCPTNTTAVNVGNDSYLRYCKPITSFKPESCNTACNKNMGNSTN